MRGRFATTILASVMFLLLGVKNTHAGLILTPFAGSKQSVPIDGAVHVSMPGFGGKLYDQALTSFYVGENGFVSREGPPNVNYFPIPLGNISYPKIAPFWDDIDIYDIPGLSTGIYINRVVNSFLSVSWTNVILFNDTIDGENVDLTKLRTFQTVVFESATEIQGFQFQPNDIAFGYSGFQDGEIFSTIGVTSGRGTMTPIPGSPTGEIRRSDDFLIVPNPNSNLIPWSPDSFLLFRANDNSVSGYDASVQSFSAIPEPSTLALASVLIFCLAASWKVWDGRKGATKQSAK